MSVRLLTTRLAKHGRYFLQSYWKRDIQTNIFEPNPNRARNRFTTPATGVRAGAAKPTPNALKNAFNTGSGNHSAGSVPRTGIFRFGQHARKLFIDNILNRVTPSFCEELRTQATKKLFYGDSVPFFALVGVSLATGAGVLTKEDELEGVCWEIREAANRLQSTWNRDDISETIDSSFGMDKLDIGLPIAQGCAAVVYSASFKDSMSLDKTKSPLNADLVANIDHCGSRAPIAQASLRPEMMSPIQNMSRFVHNFGSSVDNLNIYDQNSAAVAFVEGLMAREPSQQDAKEAIEESINRRTEGNNMEKTALLSLDNVSNINRYPLALKMMFNYDIQSNALSILRAMNRETVPARQRYKDESSSEWQRLLQSDTPTLPPHPNIVCMFGYFCDEVRSLPDGHILYPLAQPQRINPNGYGRNMSLFLLMKRYDCSLRALLNTHELSTRTKLLLLTQLLEAVSHINRHSIAHRDLKSDNLLIELNDDGSPPVLVISDFGCCLADKKHGLRLPYTSNDIDKGGNAALMAPEIINKKPGPFAELNYDKADLWACGAIAYEIFGLPNPFYSSSGGMAVLQGQQTSSLQNYDYNATELPPLSDECPSLVQQLIHNILHPNPSKRVSPDIAANVMQLFLWAPSTWLKAGGTPNSAEILQWLLSLTTKVMCEGRPTMPFNDPLSYNHSARRTYVEYLLICSFLTRARLRRIRAALNWIQDVV